MRKLIFLFVLLVCFFNGFSQNNSNKTQNYGYVGLQKNDPKFLALMDTAQKYLPRFIDSLSKYKARPTYYFLIKSNFNEKDKNEHMWSKPLNYETLFKRKGKVIPFSYPNFSNFHFPILIG